MNSKIDDRDVFNELVDQFARSSEDAPVSEGLKNLVKGSNEQHVSELKALSDAEIEELTSFEGANEYLAELLKDKEKDYRLTSAEQAKVWFLSKFRIVIKETRGSAQDTLSAQEDSDDEVS